MAGPTLNPDEVNALMSAIQEGKVSSEHAAGPAAVPYDLTSQDRIIRGQMPTLDAIDDSVASTFGTALSGRTRLAMRVAATPSTMLKFVDFSAMLAPPATVCVLSLGLVSGQALLVLEPGLADALLAAALGDRKARPDEVPAEVRRDLTTLEKQVLKRLLTLFTDAMTAAWAPVLPVRAEVARFEPDPRLAMIAPPNDAAVLCSFELTGALTGRLQLAIPYAVVEPVKKQLSAPPRPGGQVDARFTRTVEEELNQVNVDVRAVYGRATMALSEVLELEVGNVLTLDTAEGQAIPLFVEGREKLAGVPHVVNGAMAVVVERACDQPPPERAHADSQNLVPRRTLQ